MDRSFADDDQPRGVALGSAGAFDTDVYGGGDKFAGYAPTQALMEERWQGIEFGWHFRVGGMA